MNFIQAHNSGRPEMELACTSAYDGYEYSDYIDRCTECGLISINRNEYKAIAVSMYQFQMKSFNMTSVHNKYHISEK